MRIRVGAVAKLISIAAVLAFVSGCQTIPPEKVAENLSVSTPEGGYWRPSSGPYKGNVSKPVPVVFFLQGSGGGNSRSYSWASWFKQHGVGSVIISSDKMRDRKNLYGVPNTAHGADVEAAMDIIKQHPGIDLSRYAIMGFSRGGTASLTATKDLKEGRPLPDFVFSLYPGYNSSCPNYTKAKTDAHVFYGELDDWGTYQGIRNSCKSMASQRENTTFHLLKDAHHGYDGEWGGKWKCCRGRTFTSESNPEAKLKTQGIILNAMKKKWAIKQ